MPRSALLLLATAAAALLVLVLAGSSQAAFEVEQATLSLADGQASQETLVDRSVHFRMVATWDGMPEGKRPLLAVEPLPRGWSYTVGDAVSTYRGYEVAEDGDLRLTLDVPPTARAGVYILEPRLDHPEETRTLASVQVSVLVEAYPLTLEVGGLASYSMHAGQLLDGELLAGAKAPVVRDVSVRPSWYPEGWDVQVHQPTVRVEPDRSSVVPISVRAANSSLPGQYAVMLTAESSDPRAEEATLELQFHVRARASLVLAEGSAELAGALGGSATTRFVVENRGNAPTQVFTVVPSGPPPKGWSVTATGLPVEVAAFGRASVHVTVNLPESPLEARAGETTIPVTFLTTSASTDLTAELVVRVPEVRELGLAMADAELADGVIDLRPKDSRDAVVELTVRDGGNLRGIRRVNLSALYEWPVKNVTLSPSTVFLQAAMEWTINMTVDVAEEAPPGLHHVTVVATDDDGSSGELPLRFRMPRLSASLVGDLEVTTDDALGPVTQGTPQALRLEGAVVNDGNDTVEFAQVHIYDSTAFKNMYLGYVPVENLTAGETREFGFPLDSDEPGDHVLEARLDVPGAYPGANASSRVEQEMEAVPTDDDGWGLALAVVIGSAVGAITGLLALLGTEAGRFALLLFVLVPLYTRLKPDQVRDQFVRGQILGYVKANPGETYTSIRKALKLSNGQFVYHARILESQGLLKSIKDGANRRFYPEGMRIPKEVKDVKLNQVQRIIYTIILEYPGISQSKIAKMMELAPSTVNYHVNIMSKTGVIERRRSGRLSLCFVADDTE